MKNKIRATIFYGLSELDTLTKAYNANRIDKMVAHANKFEGCLDIPKQLGKMLRYPQIIIYGCKEDFDFKPFMEGIKNGFQLTYQSGIERGFYPDLIFCFGQTKPKLQEEHFPLFLFEKL